MPLKGVRYRVVTTNSKKKIRIAINKKTGKVVETKRLK